MFVPHHLNHTDVSLQPVCTEETNTLTKNLVCIYEHECNVRKPVFNRREEQMTGTGTGPHLLVTNESVGLSRKSKPFTYCAERCYSRGS